MRKVSEALAWHLVDGTALEEAVEEEPNVLTMFREQPVELPKDPVVTMDRPNRLCGQGNCIWDPSGAADVRIRA